MDTRSKILFGALIFLFLFTSILSYQRIVVAQAYDVYVAVPCDASFESCFNRDSAGYTEEEMSFSAYKIVRKKMYDIPESCSVLSHEECPALTGCPDGEDCEVIYCDEGTAEEEEAECVVETPEVINEELQ